MTMSLPIVSHPVFLLMRLNIYIYPCIYLFGVGNTSGLASTTFTENWLRNVDHLQTRRNSLSTFCILNPFKHSYLMCSRKKSTTEYIMLTICQHTIKQHHCFTVGHNMLVSESQTSGQPVTYENLHKNAPNSELERCVYSLLLEILRNGWLPW